MSNLTSTSTSSKINVSTSQTRTTINLSPSNVDNSGLTNISPTYNNNNNYYYNNYEYRSSSSVAPITKFYSQDDNFQINFSYTWIIKDFQDFFKNSRGHEIYSDRFSSPSETFQSPSTTNPGFSWRLVLFPNDIILRERNHISIFLLSYINDYERKYNLHLQSKIIRYGFNLYKINDKKSENLNLNDNVDNENDENQVTDMNYKSNEKIDLNCTSTSSNEKIDEKDSEMILLRSIPPSTEMYFPDDVRELTSHGIKNFCDFETIFPEKNFDQSITLVIIINFYKLEIEEINNIDDDSENMNGNFIESFNNPICSDILFNLDCGSKIYAKSEFLAMKSPFFKKLFDGEVTFQEVEAGVKRVFIKNTKYDYFRLVIYFAYTGKIESLEEQNLSYDDLIQLLMMAQSFEYKEFGNEITLRLGNIINLENWDEILLINKRIGCSELKCKVLKFINENWNQIRDINWIKKFVDLDDFELIEEIFEAKFFKH